MHPVSSNKIRAKILDLGYGGARVGVLCVGGWVLGTARCQHLLNCNWLYSIETRNVVGFYYFDIRDAPFIQYVTLTNLQRKGEFQFGVKESAAWKFYFVGTQSPLRALKTVKGHIIVQQPHMLMPKYRALFFLRSVVPNCFSRNIVFHHCSGVWVEWNSLVYSINRSLYHNRCFLPQVPNCLFVVS